MLIFVIYLLASSFIGWLY